MEAIKTYYQLTKPGIIYGNVIVTIAAFLLASRGFANGPKLLATAMGVALVVASACVVNNYIDRDIDRKMERTKKRALPAGKVKAMHVLVYAVVLGLLGFGLLSEYTNWVTWWLGVVAYVTYTLFYAIAKRSSVYGTLVGSIPGALPPVAGYTAVTGAVDGGAMLLFAIMVFWQMPHFYAIGMYRYGDYKAAGLPVLPVKAGMAKTKVQIVVYAAGFLVVSALLAILGYAGMTYLAVMTLLGVVWLAKAIQGLKAKDDTVWAKDIFLFSLWVLMIFSVLLSLDWLLP